MRVILITQGFPMAIGCKDMFYTVSENLRERSVPLGLSCGKIARVTPFSVPKIIGHRGARSTAPENTLAGIRQAKREGATWVEFDVKLTADGYAILMHDETLERTTSGQ